ncbi:hypothetical protein LR48_Vigan03g187800 [Vigna angularis]|uniref:Omega-hydroxypalmitate O-feruloyl transferase n=2 Tax=Phaseolus angularis TaxID=3914 RepID=A0A0L9U6X0_PHAAN|nr:acyltransferase GLAUCE [Vigna angularis]KOM38496.1 hypothetical protein LR48_Vigan03g187800 [Vigna angularis]BAT84883.1 hypothetical protein VIGAN_04235200 [Vigna angularis var. angularis]
MGTSCLKSASLLHDLKVTIHKTSTIFPSKEMENKSLFLTNIDRVVNFDVDTLHFFAANKAFSFQKVAEKLKKALEDALVHYSFLAGRLRQNPETKRLEIDCNAKGAEFVVASSKHKLTEIGDLAYPNPAYAQLVHKSKDLPLCAVQLTSFDCGGFAMGFTTSHVAFDGLSFKTFLDNLAALAANKPLAVIPCHDRHLLAARSPPRVTFPNPELIELDQSPTGIESSVFDASKEEVDFRILKLTSKDILSLKEKAKGSTNASNTGFNVITAHIWRCKALSAPYDPAGSSTILFAVDIRSKLNPPLPEGFAGNAVITAFASAKYEELEKGEFSRLVEMVKEGAERMSDEYVRSVIDRGELGDGFPRGDVLVSSWWRLGFEKVEYPWGKPKYCCPLVHHRKDIILLFPPFGAGGDDGINIIVALPTKEMEKFESLFHMFLRSV